LQVAFVALPIVLSACSPTPTDPSATSDNLGASVLGIGGVHLVSDGLRKRVLLYRDTFVQIQ
jgi:hypothetical protein